MIGWDSQFLKNKDFPERCVQVVRHLRLVGKVLFAKTDTPQKTRHLRLVGKVDGLY